MEYFQKSLASVKFKIIAGKRNTIHVYPKNHLRRNWKASTTQLHPTTASNLKTKQPETNLMDDPNLHTQHPYVILDEHPHNTTVPGTVLFCDCI